MPCRTNQPWPLIAKAHGNETDCYRQAKSVAAPRMRHIAPLHEIEFKAATVSRRLSRLVGFIDRA